MLNHKNLQKKSWWEGGAANSKLAAPAHGPHVMQTRFSDDIILSVCQTREL